jgi:predicted DNA-binding transcriptional regulator YafY
MNDPTARTLALLSLLQTRRYWKGHELAGRLDVSERTVRRDVDRLRQLGYPVDAEPGSDGGYRLAVGSNIPPLLFDDDEAMALVVGLRSTALAAIGGIEDAALAAMTKLELILPDRIRRRIEALRSSVEVMTWGGPTGSVVSAEALTVLSQGCRDREEVRFDYERRDGEQSARLVQPHQLVAAGRRWYLVAWDVRRGDFRTFRVDRMSGVPTLAGARFERRELPTDDAVSFVRQGMRASVDEYTATVTVRGSADDVRSFAHWLAADVESLSDGHATIRLRAEQHDWLAAMIAMLATRFDIELDDVDDRVREQLTRAATRIESLQAD